MEKQRQGILVKPYERLSEKQIGKVDEVSRSILEEQGLLCYNKNAAARYAKAGASVKEESGFARVQIPSSLVDKALDSVPSTIVLGARNPENKLILDSQEPRVRFGSGSETNIWLDLKYEDDKPVFSRLDGSIERLRNAAHLCENLDNLDFFIRCVNIQDKSVTPENKDINKFLASLNNITRHVQAGLTDLKQLDNVIKMGRIIAGGDEAFEKNPVLSFITCAIKSPLQMVDDTAETFMEISSRRVPVVISSCPMGGATGPFDEFAMVSVINAELLAGITLNQIVSPGAPILYGAVPVRTRLDNLNDMYRTPEFTHYNIDCAQMARFYGVPCYSTAGVADCAEPGIQATVEKMLTLSQVPRGGAQYIHYAFGLLERTNTFSPEQAIMDDAHIGVLKYAFREPVVADNAVESVKSMLAEVMESSHKTFIYNLPLPTQDDVYVKYPLESGSGGSLKAAHERYQEILKQPRNPLPGDVLDRISAEIPEVLPETIV